RQRADVGLVEQGADSGEVLARQRQQLGILDDELEVDRVVGVEERLGGRGLGAAVVVALQKLAGQLADHRLEDLVLVLEVVVEGARGEVGAAHDIAHACRAKTHLGEHRARRLEERRAVLRLVLLAPARPLALFRRDLTVVFHGHLPSCASSWRRPATMSSIARAAACTVPRRPTKPWISDSNSWWMVFTPAAVKRSA